MHILSDINIHLENKRVSRLFFVFLWLLYALVYMTKNCFTGALSIIVADGALTLTQASWINASFYFVYAPLQVLGGIFADKYSPEKLIMIGLLGSAASNLVIFFNQSFTVILISWIFNAIFQFALWPAVFKAISSQLVRSDRSRMVFLMSFSSSGGLIFAYIVATLAPKWQYNFAISAVTLTLLTITLLIFCHLLDPMMKKDKTPPIEQSNNDRSKKCSANMWRIFLISGFFSVLIAMFFRTMVENSAKTLSSTMLMQSYEYISPVIGNLLNVPVIIAGLAGMLLIKFLVFPRLIKNELACCLLMMGLSFPFVVLLRFVGNLPVPVMVISLCMISMFLSANGMLINFFVMCYTPYGLNGTAAGIMNAAMSLGFAIQYCLFGSVADSSGWPTVTILWITLMVAAMVFMLISIRPFKRFVKKTQKEKE